MGFGVITEQGNLGLGFKPISKEEEKIVNENTKIDNKDSDKKDEKTDKK